LDNEIVEGAMEAPAGEWSRRHLSTVGNKKLLAVRESRSSSSEVTISDEIFGTEGDEVNLKSQYAACSYNQLTFEAYVDTTLGVNNGVLTVTIPEEPAGTSNGVIRNSMVNAATSKLGKLTDKVDYVMLCVPPGTSDSWIAYAYINHWLSGMSCSSAVAIALKTYTEISNFSLHLFSWIAAVYNDNWCNYPSGQMHELGKYHQTLETLCKIFVERLELTWLTIIQGTTLAWLMRERVAKHMPISRV
jgi:hypothetical protein